MNLNPDFPKGYSTEVFKDLFLTWDLDLPSFSDKNPDSEAKWIMPWYLNKMVAQNMLRTCDVK